MQLGPHKAKQIIKKKKAAVPYENHQPHRGFQAFGVGVGLK